MKGSLVSVSSDDFLRTEQIIRQIACLAKFSQLIELILELPQKTDCFYNDFQCFFTKTKPKQKIVLLHHGWFFPWHLDLINAFNPKMLTITSLPTVHLDKTLLFPPTTPAFSASAALCLEENQISLVILKAMSSAVWPLNSVWSQS
jgi:hypothetical protein